MFSDRSPSATTGDKVRSTLNAMVHSTSKKGEKLNHTAGHGSPLTSVAVAKKPKSLHSSLQSRLAREDCSSPEGQPEHQKDIFSIFINGTSDQHTNIEKLLEHEKTKTNTEKNTLKTTFNRQG